MIFKSIFSKHFLISIILFGALIFVAFHISFELNRARQQQMPRPIPFVEFIRAYDGDIVEYVKEIRRNTGPNTPFEIDVVDSNGRSYIDQSVRWTKEEFKRVIFPEEMFEASRSFDHHRPPHGPPPPTIMDHRGPPPEPPETIMRVGEDKFVVIKDHFRGPRPNFDTLFILLGLAILLSSAISLYVLFNTFRKRAAMAENVISQLQHGNLKARFPITKVDEVGKIMLAFNKMADEIERVVHNLHDNEKTRISLLQELAHDLRTPVASLKNLVETLQSKSETMKEEVRQEFLTLSLKEIDYFESLVEDLLFLGQVLEPKYQKHSTDVYLKNIVDQQLKIVSQKYPNIHVIANLQKIDDIKILGDEQMLTRLVRNGLENAFSFATQVVQVDAILNNDLHIHIYDDGPGLNQEELDNFGTKRKSRKFKSQNKRDRVSIGLGSVIMFAIANIHQGSVKIQNRESKGAHLTISLPPSHKS